MAKIPDPPQTLLGFDFGKKKTGVAVGQALTCTASPLTTLHSRQGKQDWLSIGRLIEEWKPDGLVVGIPYHMDGSEQTMTLAAQKFCRQLEGRYHLPVYEAEERLTSCAAEQDAGKHSKDIDKLAAQLILQDWLQQQREQNNNY